MARRLLCRMVVFSLLVMMWSGPSLAQVTSDSSASPPPEQPEKKVDVFLSGHLSGLFPQNEDLSVGGTRIPDTRVRGTIGAGIKFDVYPWFTKKILGAEIETFGLGGSVKAPRTTSGSGTTQAQGSLISISTMYNLMVRYPGETIQPYLGVGGGTSTGILHHVNITSGNVGLTDTSGDFAFAYQFLGGVRMFVTNKLFLFGEYKYFVTKYGWDSEGAGHPKVKLDVQTQIVSGGIGWPF